MKKLLFVLLCALVISCKKEEKGGVRIKEVTASPTGSEMVEITNTSKTKFDLSGWMIGDKNNPNAFKIGDDWTINFEENQIFPASLLGISIDDSGEQIYLKDKEGNVIDTWTN